MERRVAAKDWRLRPQRLRLIGSMCEEDGEPVFPPANLCPRCAELRRNGHESVLEHEVGRRNGNGGDLGWRAGDAEDAEGWVVQLPLGVVAEAEG
jgi:hypothetical protein